MENFNYSAATVQDSIDHLQSLQSLYKLKDHEIDEIINSVLEEDCNV